MKEIKLDDIRVAVDGRAALLPDWARAAVQLGAWSRYSSSVESGRLIVFCVVPCREVFTAFLGLGAVIAGGILFKKGFSWEDLVSLEPGTKIFWKMKGESASYSGVLGEHQYVNGQKLVSVSISKPARKKGAWFFSEAKFSECIFSEASLPSARRAGEFVAAENFYGCLGVPLASKWLITAGAEVQFVTQIAGFRRAFSGWSLTTESEKARLPLDQLLMLREEKETALGKARMMHRMGSFPGGCPVTIFDGPLAFQRLPDIDSASLVVVLERGEVAEEHIDFLLNASQEHCPEAARLLPQFAPEAIPRTVELAGYFLRAV